MTEVQAHGFELGAQWGAKFESTESNNRKIFVSVIRGIMPC